jgi:protein-glutamine gamma-glutamyltransferase
VKILESLGRANATKRPETSVGLRAATLVTVLIAVAAVGLTGTASTGDVLAAVILLPLGAVISHRRREERNFLLKTALAVAALAALVRFFGDLQVAATIDDTRLPLADLFLAIIIIHGFDTPQRRDLGFAVASSVALVALAAVEARPVWFAAVILAFAVAAAIASAAMQRSAAREAADRLADDSGLRPLTPTSEFLGIETAAGDQPATRRRMPAVAGPIGVLLLVGLVAFLFLPRAGVVRLGGIPFSGLGGSPVAGAGVVNPGLPFGGSQEAGDVPFNPDAYAGFAEVVDLRVLGNLSDQLVLRVRTDRPRLLRGMVFDVYSGQTWRRSSVDPELVEGIPARLSRAGRPGERESITQSIELFADTPNLLFAAAEPSDVYHAAGAVWAWDDGTLTTGAEQEEGVIYSIVSHQPRFDRDDLVDRGELGDDGFDEGLGTRYLQLPDGLPDRVRRLAEEITAGESSPYAKALAVEAWLGDNVEYALDPTPQPRDADTVDWFLFEHRIGWCEPIASSMVVLLRVAGVPARLATGFMPGARNPLTGWYDIRMSDAHAWVEVWEPHHGTWLTMDPTGAVPRAALGPGTSGSRIVAVDLAHWVRDRIVPAVLAVVPARVLAAAAGIATLAGIGLGATRLRDLRRRRAMTPQFTRLERALRRRGVPRERWQTPREYVDGARETLPGLPREPLERILEAEERRIYGDQPDAAPSAEDLREVLSSL